MFELSEVLIIIWSRKSWRTMEWSREKWLATSCVAVNFSGESTGRLLLKWTQPNSDCFWHFHHCFIACTLPGPSMQNSTKIIMTSAISFTVQQCSCGTPSQAAVSRVRRLHCTTASGNWQPCSCGALSAIKESHRWKCTAAPISPNRHATVLSWLAAAAAWYEA